MIAKMSSMPSIMSQCFWVGLGRPAHCRIVALALVYLALDCAFLVLCYKFIAGLGCGYNIFQREANAVFILGVGQPVQKLQSLRQIHQVSGKRVRYSNLPASSFPCISGPVRLQKTVPQVSNYLDRYENKAFEAWDCAWHDNERRVYVWFIVGYVHYKLLDANKLLDSQKHWNRIREAFWGKDVYFLKYQLQTIIKNRGRITWGEKQDLLLRDICPYFALYSANTKMENGIKLPRTFTSEPEASASKLPSSADSAGRTI